MYKGNKSDAGANLISAFKVSSTSDHERRFAKLLLDDWESWHAIKKLFNIPFLILKVRYPAIS